MKRYRNTFALPVLIVSAALVPFWPDIKRHTRLPSVLYDCKVNLRNVATALELYASDHSGLYPAELQKLAQHGYLKNIPTCPAAGTDTYSQSYRAVAKPDDFSLGCMGWHHGQPPAGDIYHSPLGYPWFLTSYPPPDHP